MIRALIAAILIGFISAMAQVALLALAALSASPAVAQSSWDGSVRVEGWPQTERQCRTFMHNVCEAFEPGRICHGITNPYGCVPSKESDEPANAPKDKR